MKKQYAVIFTAVMMILTMLLCLTACSGVQQNGEGGKLSPSPIGTEAVEPSQSAGALAAEAEEARAAYYEALSALLDNKVLPDGMNYGYDPNHDMSENKFAIYDLDGDGREELIIAYTTTSMAGQTQLILDYDNNAKQLHTQLKEYPLLTFYNNGVIQAQWSHNQGLAGDFWPYNLYRYDEASDTYLKLGTVDAWEKKFAPKNASGDPFPDNIDVSGTGFVYYITNDEETTNTEPVDASAYNEWHDSYLKNASELEIPYFNLTKENIEMINPEKK